MVTSYKVWVSSRLSLSINILSEYAHLRNTCTALSKHGRWYRMLDFASFHPRCFFLVLNVYTFLSQMCAKPKQANWLLRLTWRIKLPFFSRSGHEHFVLYLEKIIHSFQTYLQGLFKNTLTKLIGKCYWECFRQSLGNFHTLPVNVSQVKCFTFNKHSWMKKPPHSQKCPSLRSPSPPPNSF